MVGQTLGEMTPVCSAGETGTNRSEIISPSKNTVLILKIAKMFPFFLLNNFSSKYNLKIHIKIKKNTILNLGNHELRKTNDTTVLLPIGLWAI